MPLTGIYRITFSMFSRVETREANYAWLYHNGNILSETDYHSYSGNGVVRSTGGREVILELSWSDTLYLKSTYVQGDFHDIYFCAEYIHKHF